jgi:hypothetical protein
MDDQQMENTTAIMISQLESMGEAKYQKSELMGFLKGLNKGALKIEDNELKEDPVKKLAAEKQEVEQRKKFEEWENEMNNKDWMEEITKPMNLTTEIAEAGLEDIKEREVWDAKEMSEEELGKLMSTWNAVAEEQTRVMTDVWNKS